MNNYFKDFDKIQQFLAPPKTDLNIQKKNEMENQKDNPDEMTTIEKTKCSQCNSTNIGTDMVNANRICCQCGFVCGRIHNNTAEWRYYGYSDDNKNKDPTICGLPIDELLPKSSLTTKMKYTGNKYISLVRLHKWHQIHPEERSLFTVFKYMDKILLNINISNETKLQSKQYYKILSEKDDKKGTLTRGVIRKSFIAACILIACKNNNTPFQKIKIAELCNIDKFDITKGFKKFSALEKNKNIQLNKPVSNTIQDFICKFCNNLNFSTQMKDICLILCERFDKLGILKDTNDLSIISGLLYFVSVLFYNTNSYRAKILDLIKISKVTLEKVYKIINSHKCYLLIGLENHIKTYKT